MSHYQQSVVFDATPAAVYAAIATQAGLRGWWTQDCDIATKVGGTSHFRFGDTAKAMRVEALEPSRRVQWLCTEAHIACADLARRDEWVGTRLVFRLTPEGEGETRLDFEHVGLVPALECFDLCNKGWQHFLASLKGYVDTGRGTPYEPALAVAQ